MTRPDLDAIERAVNETPGEPDDSMIMNLIAYARHLESSAQKVIHVSYSQAQAEKEMALYRRISELETALEPFAFVGEKGLINSPAFSAYEDAARVLRKEHS